MSTHRNFNISNYSPVSSHSISCTNPFPYVKMPPYTNTLFTLILFFLSVVTVSEECFALPPNTDYFRMRLKNLHFDEHVLVLRTSFFRMGKHRLLSRLYALTRCLFLCLHRDIDCSNSRHTLAVSLTARFSF